MCRRNKPSLKNMSISIEWLSKQLDRRDGENTKLICMCVIVIAGCINEQKQLYWNCTGENGRGVTYMCIIFVCMLCIFALPG